MTMPATGTVRADTQAAEATTHTPDADTAQPEAVEPAATTEA